MRKLGTGVLVVIVAVLALISLYFGGGLLFWQGIYVSEDSVVAAVEKQGYSEVVVNDKDVFFVSSWGGECGEKDDALFEILRSIRSATGSRSLRVPVGPGRV